MALEKQNLLLFVTARTSGDFTREGIPDDSTLSTEDGLFPLSTSPAQRSPPPSALGVEPSGVVLGEDSSDRAGPVEDVNTSHSDSFSEGSL